MPMRGHYNVSGANKTSTWVTGYPFAVDFARGYPRFSPGEYTAVDMLANGEADVCFGSRFLSPGAHRVLYFWHSLGNKFLTFLSNMFTDLNLTDMETCYKVFRRDVIQSVDIKENRFGFEPEIVAKVAHMRLRIFEIGISYSGRTYEEGKKIGVRDGIRALYCICWYNAHRAPDPPQRRDRK